MQPVPVPVLSLRGLSEFISALALNMSLLISFYLICLLTVAFSMFTVSRSNPKGHVHKKKKTSGHLEGRKSVNSPSTAWLLSGFRSVNQVWDHHQLENIPEGHGKVVKFPNDWPWSFPGLTPFTAPEESPRWKPAVLCCPVSLSLPKSQRQKTKQARNPSSFTFPKCGLLHEHTLRTPSSGNHCPSYD